MELDDLIAELASIRSRLDELGDDNFGERAELVERRNELRLMARRLAGADPQTVEGISQRIRFLEQRRDQILGNRLSQNAAAQTGMGGGIDPEYVHRMNRQIAEAGGLDEITQELRRLRDALRMRTGEPPPEPA